MSSSSSDIPIDSENPSKSSSTQCLVCLSQAKHTHLGVQICRACAVFYKRSLNRKPYVCRAGTSKCKHRSKCKLCRISHIKRIVEGSKKESPSLQGVADQDNSIIDRPVSTIKMEAPSQNEAITMTRMLFPSQFSTSTGLIDRLRQSYTTMCYSRRTAEISIANPDIHPLFLARGELPLLPSTLTLCNKFTQMTTNAEFDFCNSSFPEFSSLSLHHQWLLIKNFHQSFTALESAYRVNELFPNHQYMYFTSLTTYMSLQNIVNFLDESPETERKECSMFLTVFLKNDVQACREQVKKAKLSQDEFLALICLSFWNIECSPAEDFIVEIATKYRSRILNELQSLYKQQQSSIVCANRLGELLLIVDTIMTCASVMPYKLNILRLLNDDIKKLEMDAIVD